MLVILLTALAATLAEVEVGSSRASPPLTAHGRLIKAFSPWLDEAAVKATTKTQWVTIAQSFAIVVLNSWDFRLRSYP